MCGDWRHSSTSSQKEICRSAECVSSVSGRQYSDHFQYIAPPVKKEDAQRFAPRGVFVLRMIQAVDKDRYHNDFNRLLFLTETQSAYCERGTAHSNVFSTNPGLRPSLSLSVSRLFSLASRTGNAPLVCVLPALPISTQNWTVLLGASRLEMNRLGRSMPVGWRLLVSLISPH